MIEVYALAASLFLNIALGSYALFLHRWHKQRNVLLATMHLLLESRARAYLQVCHEMKCKDPSWVAPDES